MASRKDQLHSYQFMMQRVISSVVLHETDPEQAPLRRGVGALFGGVMLTGLLVIVFGVYAIISGNAGNRWQNEGAIVIERETGAHYVYQGGILLPVLNYASARLISGNPDTKRVPGRNLAGIPRAIPVGIPGAPDSLPPAGRSVGAPWTICSVLGQDATGTLITVTTLLVGDGVPGAEPFADQAMLVRDSEDSTVYLVWRSHRYRLVGDDTDQIIRSLYGFAAGVVDAGTAWLNGLPSGQDIGPVEIADRGEASSAVAGYEIGDVVYHPVAGGQQDYLVLDDGLAHVTELQVLLLRGHYAVEPVEISAAAANAAPTSDALAPPAGNAAAPPRPPDLLPIPTAGPVTLCAETTEARSPPQITLGGDLQATESALPTSQDSPEGARLVDWVLVPPGHVAVVRALPSDTSGVGAYNLVTDVGLRYPVPTDLALGNLGYTATDAVEMPAALVQRIPAGPTLDPEAARLPAPVRQ